MHLTQYHLLAEWSWSIANHAKSPLHIKRLIMTVLLIRRWCETVLLNIPNELLFLIFDNVGCQSLQSAN
jgi:hypothetical protein